MHNPSSRELIATLPDADATGVDRAVAAAGAALPAWMRRAAIWRARHSRAVAAKLRKHKTRLARRISLVQGKILPLAAVEIDFTANSRDDRGDRGYRGDGAEWARRIERRDRSSSTAPVRPPTSSAA